MLFKIYFFKSFDLDKFFGFFRHSSNIKTVRSCHRSQSEKFCGPSKCPAVTVWYLLRWFAWFSTFARFSTTFGGFKACLHVSNIFNGLHGGSKLQNGSTVQETIFEIHFRVGFVHVLFVFIGTGIAKN